MVHDWIRYENRLRYCANSEEVNWSNNESSAHWDFLQSKWGHGEGLIWEVFYVTCLCAPLCLMTWWQVSPRRVHRRINRLHVSWWNWERRAYVVVYWGWAVCGVVADLSFIAVVVCCFTPVIPLVCCSLSSLSLLPVVERCSQRFCCFQLL